MRGSGPSDTIIVCGVGPVFYYGTKTKSFLAHREIAEKIALDTSQLIDHLNHIESGLKLIDNRRINLRAATRSQNSQNRRKTTNKKSSQYVGVSWVEKWNKWRAILKNKELGSFSTEKEAAEVYNNEALRVYGNFAFLNQVNKPKAL